MKTNTTARRVWKLRLIVGCLTIAAVGSFDLWVTRYCCANLSAAKAQQIQSQPMGNWNTVGQALVLAGSNQP